MTLFKDLLFNLLFIISLSLIVQYILRVKISGSKRKYDKLIFIASAMIQVVFCISYSYSDSNGFLYDLRLIPLAISCLYGGISAGIVVFFFTVLIRIPFGGSGVELNIFTIMAITAVISFISIKFQSLRLGGKLTAVAVIGITYSILFAFIKGILYHAYLDLPLAAIYTATLLVGLLIITYSMEIIEQNSLLREAIVKSEKIEVISHLAASVSHEVRNPLTVTRGFLQMLKDPGIPEDKRQYYLETAIEELDRAEMIIKEYLSFSKPNDDQAATLDVKAEIEKAVELLMPYANHSSVSVSSQLAKGLYIRGEASKFQQCLLNIVKNGIEAMPDGGDLTIQSFALSDRFAVIKIKDNGMGMTPAQIAKLGEPYFSTKKEKGTGLGMMVVLKLIRELGGTLEASSTPMQGTLFTITIPLATSS
ncbi:HAMP domain-containing sensor histidine kinase [Bacillus sp. FJAT-27251]|uniref:sensor histidine kinase n=1 Tax=Bacillus sp. FJAT-27251 TaxID=1684142 RepID=UPI0006A798B4|nr:HAMP domain-containing sensor histidine kinase [Bacillus sp. FJAT-27251]